MPKSNITEHSAEYYTDRVDRELAEQLSIEDYTTRQKFS